MTLVVTLWTSVDSQPTMEETILVGDDLMMGPPSPVIPPEIASHVLEGVDLCDGILRNLFLCKSLFLIFEKCFKLAFGIVLYFVSVRRSLSMKWSVSHAAYVCTIVKIGRTKVLFQWGLINQKLLPNYWNSMQKLYHI